MPSARLRYGPNGMERWWGLASRSLIAADPFDRAEKRCLCHPRDESRLLNRVLLPLIVNAIVLRVVQYTPINECPENTSGGP